MNKFVNNIYDAIVIGAGHNGLVAASYLAKANKKVLVLEQRHLVGGAALTQELIQGFRFSRCSYVLSLFRKHIIQDLQLIRKGLKIHYRDISSITPTLTSNQYLLFHKNQQKTIQEISKFSQKDAQIWPQYEQYLQKLCGFWNKNLDYLPYNYIEKPTLRDKLSFLNRIFDPKLDYFDFGKFITCSVEQMLNNWFQSDILKASLATDGIIGENLSVAHHSTAYVLLHHVMGELEEGHKGQWGYVEGGNGRLSELLAQVAQENGATIRLKSKVQQILYNNDKKAVGVKLINGQIVQGKQILSNCTNRVTFTDLIKNASQILPLATYNKIKNTEYNGAATKINLALKKLPKFKCFSSHHLKAQSLLQGTIHVNCQSMTQLKSAYQCTKFSRMSTRPFMDITIPTIFDKTLCPQGYHIMNCFLQYTPYRPNNGDPSLPISHTQIERIFLSTINEYLEEPLDVHYLDILTPHDLQQLIGLTEGNIFHGSIGIQNIYTNRLSGKVGGVWICGSSAHPGGGVMGAVGKQVADRLLYNQII